MEVAGCRHGLALRALNMFRGEMYAVVCISVCIIIMLLCSFGYPHYLHTMVFPNASFLWSDVICQYWPWAQKLTTTHSELQETMKATPCLSVMHAKAHSWPCQVYKEICTKLCRYYGVVGGLIWQQ